MPLSEKCPDGLIPLMFHVIANFYSHKGNGIGACAGLKRVRLYQKRFRGVSRCDRDKNPWEVPWRVLQSG